MQRLAFPQTSFDPSGFSLRSSPSAPNNNCFLVVSTIIKRHLFKPLVKYVPVRSAGIFEDPIVKFNFALPFANSYFDLSPPNLTL